MVPRASRCRRRVSRCFAAPSVNYKKVMTTVRHNVTEQFPQHHQARNLHGHGITDGAAPKVPYLRGIESACTASIDPTFYGMATFANRCPGAIPLVRKPQLERNMLERYVHLRAVVVRVVHCQAWHVFETRHLSISA